MDFDKNKFFDELDDVVKKAAKKNDKKKEKKLDKKDPFNYGFDLENIKSKKNKKKNVSDKDKSKKKEKKEKTKKIKPDQDKTEISLGDGKFAKKVLKQLRSKELQESFKHDKVLIDTKKFWTKD